MAAVVIEWIEPRILLLKILESMDFYLLGSTA